MSKERRDDKPAGGPFGRGPMLSMAMPPEKVKDFKGTLKRLVGYLKPYYYKLVTVLIAAVLSTVFSIVSPKIMGLATTSLFDSFLSGSGVDYEFIAQRVSTVMGANRIVVMHDGCIAGMGTHKELLESCNIYREIVLSQFSEEEIA